MLCECHAHMFMNGINYKEAVRLQQDGVRDDLIHKNLKAYADKDIFFVRDGGDNLMVSHRAKELAGEYGIDYRTPVFAIHKNGYYGGIVGHGFDTVREYHGLVKKAAGLQADFIKIMASGILDFDEFSRVSTPLDDEKLIHEMVRIAHEEGFAVMVHVNTPRQILYALEAGCDSVEHGYYMDDDCRRVFLETGAVWVPTIATSANLRPSDRFNREAVERIYQCHLRNVREAFLCGMHIASGSDAGAYLVPHGQGLLDELSCFKEACGKDPVLLEKAKSAVETGNARIRDRFKRS